MALAEAGAMQDVVAEGGAGAGAALHRAAWVLPVGPKRGAEGEDAPASKTRRRNGGGGHKDEEEES